MKCLLVILHQGIASNQIDRLSQILVSSFGSITLDIAVVSEHIDNYRLQITNSPILPYTRMLLSQYEITVFIINDEVDGSIKCFDDDIQNTFQLNKAARIFTLDQYGRLKTLKKELDESEYPFLNTHAFNRLSHRLIEGFYYFPYGYLFRYCGSGPINELGLRIPKDLSEYINRDINHKVITIFGGSAAFGVFIRYEETFAYKLEQLLNQYMSSINSPCHFSVLNFSQPGAVVMNEITLFTTFCYQMKPDFVIAHDGYNDLYYGQMSDSYLLNKYHVTYQNNTEEWSQILHNSQDTALTWKNAWPEVNAPVINYPRSITQAYGNRQLQFQTIVRSFGSEFIAGLQPMLFSKKAHSSQEKASMNYHLAGWYTQQHKRMPFLYEKYEKQSYSSEIANFLNFHHLFQDQTGDFTSFVDMMHTSPDGDSVIAEIYFNYIRDHFISRLLSNNSSDV